MKSHRDSIGITHRDKICPDTVHRERDKPRKGLSLPVRPDAENTVEKVAPGYVPPSHPRKRLSAAERSRRAWCRWKALMRLLGAAGPGQSFDAVFARVRRRWPVSTAGSEFEDRARQVWEKEVTAAVAALPGGPLPPPSPPRASRRLVAIRRMAGAPLDPDETIEDGQCPVERRLGELLREGPRNVGAKGSKVTGSKREPVKDTTPTLASQGIDKKLRRHRIYISGPLTSSGNVLDNLARAVDAARALIDAGFAPFCPHLTYHVDPGSEYPHATWIEIELPWVAVADALLRLPGESVGADLEVARAEELGIPVFATISDLAGHFTVAGDETTENRGAGSGDPAAATARSNQCEQQPK